MSKIIKFFKSDQRWFLLIVVLAVYLRFSGVNPGYQPYHPDEGISYSAASSMIKNGNIDSLRYDYPAVVPLANALFYKTFFVPLQWTKFYLTNLNQIINKQIKLPLEKKEYKKIFQEEILGSREINALFWSRYVTAFFGVGVVILTYFLAATLFNRQIGLLSAFLVSINYREVLNSHLGLPDIYNAFFLLAATLSAVYLWQKPTKMKYWLTAILVGFSFSTKYQLFALAPFALVHLYLTYQQKNWKSHLRCFFRWEVLLVPFLVLLTFVVLNPYHIAGYQETLNQIHNVSLKYGMGAKVFYLYPYSYLYHIGIGAVTSLLIIGGLIWGIKQSFQKSLLLLSIIIPFFYLTTYYSTGGFYTRNFVTVIPFLLIFAGFVLSKLWDLKINSHLSKASLMVFLVVLILAVKENLANSLVVTQEYTKPWNYKILSLWIGKNIAPGSKVAAHSSVPLPDYIVSRLLYDFEEDFSIDEFKASGADYAIANLDWATNQFYGWMTQAGQPHQDFEKPVNRLEQTYAAMAVRELSVHTVYSVINPWQAPESDFIIAKIPEYKASNLEEIASFNFRNSNQNWSTKGSVYKNIQLPVGEKGLSIGGEAVGEEVIRWESPPIDNIMSGFVIKANIVTKSEELDKNAYLAVNFYENEEDANDSLNRVGVRISKRLQGSGEHQLELIGAVPTNSNYFTISFRNYNAAKSQVILSSLELYSTNVKVDYGGVKVNSINLDTNVLFPNSHGNL
ncbi:MAG: glycosyltransferase family 39 protein [Candidatus Daviesbacteria bacterium]|nr:MAG: glycosyltransferase family 39 protein [Candidatus Daviesbacteria bacterium]